MTDRERENIARLRSALREAQKHLEYVGYGDSWERECAMEAGLAEKIEDGLRAARNLLG